MHKLLKLVKRARKVEKSIRKKLSLPFELVIWGKWTGTSGFKVNGVPVKVHRHSEQRGQFTSSLLSLFSRKSIEFLFLKKSD